MPDTPGKVVLFGSGETSPSGRLALERLFSELAPPIRVAILETPAGFQPNSAVVAQEIADFMASRLRNYSPMISIIPARRKEPPHSTDDPGILYPMLRANCVFMGPGSPSYTVRHVKDSLAYSYLTGRHRRGAAIILASAATIALSSKALPVYEIFKAGHDLYWMDGLDFFMPFGLDLAIVPHWDNREGGEKLDTSRCYMGVDRWNKLFALLPEATTVLGIDEHTAVFFDLQAGQAEVFGKGGITIQSYNSRSAYERGSIFGLDKLGPFHAAPQYEFFLPEVGAEVVAACNMELPPDIAGLVEGRKKLRKEKRWQEADSIRQQLRERGYEVQDTPEGSRWCYTGHPGSSK